MILGVNLSFLNFLIVSLPILPGSGTTGSEGHWDVFMVFGAVLREGARQTFPVPAGPSVHGLARALELSLPVVY